MKPIVTIGDHTFVSVKHNNVILLSVTQKNINVMVTVNFMYQVIDGPAHFPVRPSPRLCGT